VLSRHLLVDEQEVLLSTPPARPATGCGPCGRLATCASFDVNAVCWSKLGRALICRKRKQLVDGRKRGKTPVVPRAMPSCPIYERRPNAGADLAATRLPGGEVLENATTRSGRSAAAPMTTQSRREEALMHSCRTNSIRLRGTVHAISLDPLLPFNIGPMNGQDAPRSGHSENNPNGSVRP
jgi:hypothetical protein